MILETCLSLKTHLYVQVHDYRLAITLCSGEEFLSYYLFLIKVIMLTGKYKLYPKALLLNYFIILHHRDHHTSIWKLFQEDVTCLNEEWGEHSFSILSRASLHHTRLDHEHVERLYRMIHTYKEVLDGLQSRSQDPDHSSLSSRVEITPDSKDLSATSEFFSHQIRLLESKTFRPYAPIPKTGARSTHPRMDPTIQEPLHRHIHDDLQSLVREIQGLGNTWVDKNQEGEWPLRAMDDHTVCDDMKALDSSPDVVFLADVDTPLPLGNSEGSATESFEFVSDVDSEPNIIQLPSRGSPNMEAADSDTTITDIVHLPESDIVSIQSNTYVSSPDLDAITAPIRSRAGRRYRHRDYSVPYLRTTDYISSSTHDLS